MVVVVVVVVVGREYVVVVVVVYVCVSVGVRPPFTFAQRTAAQGHHRVEGGLRGGSVTTLARHRRRRVLNSLVQRRRLADPLGTEMFVRHRGRLQVVVVMVEVVVVVVLAVVEVVEVVIAVAQRQRAAVVVVVVVVVAKRRR